MHSWNLIRLGALATLAAGATLVAEASIDLLYPVMDHTSPLGFLSEALFAAFWLFVLGALPGLRSRQAGRHGAVGKTGFFAAFVGLALLVPLAVSVLITGNEPPESIVTVVALTAFIGLILFGIAVFRARVLPRWCGPVLAISFPAVFFGGYAGAFVVGIAWLAMGYALWPEREESARQPARAG